MGALRDNNENSKCSKEEHLKHIAHAIEVFESQHGSEYRWNPDDIRFHDLLLNRINEEDGFA